MNIKRKTVKRKIGLPNNETIDSQQSNNDQQKQAELNSLLKKFPFSEGIIIGLVTLLAYYIHLFMSIGFFTYFHIPASYISFELSNLLPSSFIIGTIIFLIISVVNDTFFRYRTRDKERLLITLVIFSMLVGQIFLSWGNWSVFVITGIVLLSLSLLQMIIYFIIKTIRNRKVRGIRKSVNYLKQRLDIIAKNNSIQSKEEISNIYNGLILHEKSLMNLEEEIAKENKELPKSERDASKSTYFNILLFPLLMLLSILCMDMGKIIAITSTDYYVLTTNTENVVLGQASNKAVTECAILTQTSDIAICALFDREKKVIDPLYKIIYFQNSTSSQLSYEKIGPLHLKPTATPTAKPTFTPTITITPLPTFTPISTQTAIPVGIQ